ncbi:PREDICTED: scarecrow-like protein 14 isoform X2 [Ipomoea nil]|uniref:scarecrow-like protein 14 isoform X2 n=1 Tax=Ipomoea nil TaxID=35883 RepID=UPI0009013A3F|nr:PREDICTED: scarecrow-like protein 14 isoform X2 [Ipomoea nil]
MDRGPYETTSQFNFEDETPPIFPNPNLVNWQNLGVEGLSTFSYPTSMANEGVCETLVDRNEEMGNLNNEEAPVPQSGQRLNVVNLLNEDGGYEDYDLRDQMLKWINQMLMEDNVEKQAYMFRQSAALKDAERSFYELIGEEYPPSPNLHRVPDLDRNENYGNDDSLCPNWDSNPRDHVPVGVASSTTSQSSSSLGQGTVNDGTVDFATSTITIPDISNCIESVEKGVREASSFLPTRNSLLVDGVGVEKNTGNQDLLEGRRGKKNMFREDMHLAEERCYKQSAIYVEPSVKQEEFDEVLLCSEEDESNLCHSLRSVSCDSKGSNRKKSSGSKRAVVDFRSLLTLCAQAVAVEDIRTANDYLKHIRQHSSQTGDDMQRLAHYFADALEARIAGSGTRIYKALVKYPRYAARALKAFHLYLSSCPFRKIANMFSNKTITTLAQNASSLHIIDFGIGTLFGFQWPCLIQHLSSRPGGPPKLRITGIDFPQSGFRPAERAEGTGRLLTYYAQKFNVPFEFNAIAKKWETITVEDLKIIEGEVLVVNCLYRLRNLLDDTVVVNSLSPRDTVLKLIHDVHPDVFIHGILNSACNAPFFTSRFRAALSHYSAVFDMLEATIPREVHERMLIESYIFGQQAMNAIACEDTERVERPETYKMWQARNTRAGFLQLPLNREIVKMSMHMLKLYHKEFVIDEDGHWLLLGWKGRALFALSSWKPA